MVVVWVARRGRLHAGEVHAFALKLKNRPDVRGIVTLGYVVFSHCNVWHLNNDVKY